MSDWELTDEEICKALRIPYREESHPISRRVVHAAARKAWWLAIYKLEQVHGEFSAGARLLRAEAQVAGLDPWSDAPR